MPPSQEKREKAAKKGNALPDGSFPINTVEDLKKAVRAFGRASDPDKVKRHIVKRARALGRTDLLPANWNASRRAEATVFSPLRTPTRQELVAELQVKARRATAMTASARPVHVTPLLAVYRRGVSSWTPETGKGLTAHEHGHARVNAFLHLLTSGVVPEGHRDSDLLPRR